MRKRIKQLTIGILTAAILSTGSLSIPVLAADNSISEFAVKNVPGYYMCTATDVNIRSGPGTGYSVVGTLNFGDTVYVTWCKYGWAKIANKQYVSAQYLSEVVELKLE